MARANREKDDMAGLFTKTVVHSPVIRWILHARIRHKHCNDVVFVGDHFVQVKQLQQFGHLENIATKNNFDSRIRGAKAFSNIAKSDTDDDDFLVKTEDDDHPPEGVPPQCIVLTTEANDLLFLHLTSNGNGTFRFVQQQCPMPTFERTLYQPGEHLAIDPYSRALAVAANEREVVIYSAKSKVRVQHEVQTADQNWCPVSAQRPLQVDGVIQHLDFLYPTGDSSSSHNNDQIVLLLIIISQRKIRAEWIEWHSTSDIHHAVHHRGQPLETSNSVPSLLIPLQNAAFLLINGSDMTKWDDILCGAARPTPVFTDTDVEEIHRGASSRWPVWANWCRPVRGSGALNNTDYLYLVREDGRVYLIQVTDRGAELSHAGDFRCHVGSAFASLGSSRDPDVLAVAGDMSNGSIQSIGDWCSTPFRARGSSRIETMAMDRIETIPNWASITDMVTSKLPGKSQRSRDGIFVTSGRQPYGAIAEVRRGLEARLSAYCEIPDLLRSVTGVWALPLASSGRALLVLSSPTGTRFLNMSGDADMEDIEEIEESDIGLDPDSATLVAASLADGTLVQVTEKSIRISPGTTVNFEDCSRVDCGMYTTMSAATIEPSRSLTVVSEKYERDPGVFGLVCYKLHVNDAGDMGDTRIHLASQLTLSSEPLALALTASKDHAVLVVTTADARLTTFTVAEDGKIQESCSKDLPSAGEGASLCDSVVILHSETSIESDKLLLTAVCGLRDGRLYACTVDSGSAELLDSFCVMAFSETRVKMTQPHDNRAVAYAISNLDTCLVTREGDDISSMQIQSIWFTDKQRPELAQGAVSACDHMPAEHLLGTPDLAGSMVTISGGELLMATLELAPTTVPRQILVSGTPNRLIYAEQQRCLVCASMKYNVRSFPSSAPHGRPEERRQIFPVIDFVPSRSSKPSYSHEMQPGEQVYSLLEWSFKQSEDKTYSFVLVGGSYTRSSGSVRGRITFLQPVNRSWEVVDVKEGRSLTFEAPVYAMALVDGLTLVVCSGLSIDAYHFSEEERKWEQICATLQIMSPGTSITTLGSILYISTNADSLIKVELCPGSRSGGSTTIDEHPYYLRLQTLGPRAERLLSHLVLARSDDHSAEANPNHITQALMTNKDGQVVGLRHDPTRRANAAELLFEAQLPRSLTRIRRCNVRPSWKASPPHGVLEDGILGCAADGALVGVAVLDTNLWRRLSWLQRLCEWSQELCPHSWQTPAYNVTEGSHARDERAMPVGLGGGRENVVMKTSKPKLQDGHVDGDVLARLLEGGTEVAKSRLRRMMEDLTAQENRGGEWMRGHLEQELGVVDEIVEIVQRVVDMWL